ncbi:hypothetical protein [Arthrobacter sp. Z4-13]
MRYEVEHVRADHFERHSDGFNLEADYARRRNRIIDLLLLPKQQFNASYTTPPAKRI